MVCFESKEKIIKNMSVTFLFASIVEGGLPIQQCFGHKCLEDKAKLMGEVEC